MEENIKRIVLSLLPFLFSLCFHEYAHAWIAKKLGDPTAQYSGRLTMNPMAHIDIMWTIIFPLMTLLLGGVFFGSAKPVPIDARNFKKPERDMALVALAGPVSNILLGFIFAFCFGLVVKLSGPDLSNNIPVLILLQMLKAGVYINFFLAFFNLIPLPPLDGSKVLSLFLKYKQMLYIERLAPYSFMIIMVLWFTGILNYIVLIPANQLYQVAKIAMGFL